MRMIKTARIKDDYSERILLSAKSTLEYYDLSDEEKNEL